MNARWFLALILTGSTASAEVRKLTVDDAVKIAIDANPRLLASRSRANASEDQANSVRGRYLPSLNLSDEQQHYDRPFNIAFAPGAELPVRAINTNSLVVSVNQPLLGLLHINQDHLASLDNAVAAGQQTKALEESIKEEVRTQFLRFFEARATENIARTSQTQLKEQLAVANSKLKAGVLTNADVLRVEVAVANARQQEIQAQAQEEVSRAAILADLNLAATDDTVEFLEPTDLESAAAPPALAEALAKAEKTRPELAAYRAVQSAATHQSWSKLYRLLPEFDIDAAYLHLTGQTFAQVDSAYVGFKLTWNVWSWGADWYQRQSAVAQEVAAGFDVETLRSQIGQDLSSKISIEHSASFAVDVAQTAITSAEEAFRVTEELLKAGSATTTDLLDSQSALTQSKLNLVRAKYEQAIARVAVKRATGG